MKRRCLLSVIPFLLFVVSHAQVITVPVVFHIVYNTAAENVPDSFLLDAIQVMNQDFRKQNPDTANIPSIWKPLASDCEIEFCLAQQDPQGNPTNGITRTPTTTTQFMCNNHVMYSSMGGEDIWDRNRYFNIWVCKLNAFMIYCSTQYFNATSSEDGAVIDYTILRRQSIGGYWNQQKICSNAAAEYLNLYLFYRCQMTCADCDSVPDTPNDSTGCLGSCTLTDACHPTVPGVMCSNFMSSANDSCRYFFTQGQKTRMRVCLNGPRASLLSSNVCLPVGINENYQLNGIQIFSNPSNGNFTINSSEKISSIDIMNLTGEKIYSSFLYAYKSAINLPNQSKGIYFIKINLDKGTVIKKLVIE